ncbi:proprotein convertase P-domain-containing protein [Miltoncostaea marina]|uniref:proprotein convertase P-domain-containing protein n=1 Tax=Miltoncostaea marina TaxID=2843215 RepID=UPI001C3CCF15|nr:proprotein convertase P-domain-containing protein [Miltoncostaea marina]
MTVRDHLGRSLAVGGALAVLGVGAMTMTERALAVAPDPTAGATGQEATYASQGAQNNKPVGPLAGTVTTSTITVPESAQSYLRDVDLRTFLKHSASGDVRIELTSPARPGQAARTVTLIPGQNGARGTNDVFDGTVWDDSSDVLASDLDSTLLPPEVAPQASLAPEGSLGAFVGIDPRGVWTLRVTDTLDAEGDPAVDGGTLQSWELRLATQNPAPVVGAAQTFNSGGGSVTIPNAPAPAVTKTITVSGQKNYLADLDLVTNIVHENPGELEIRLSHGGRTVVISTGSDGPTQFYSNRTFDDSASVLVGRAPEGTPLSASLIPEGALAAFRGMDPNGDWTLSVNDTVGTPTGTLHGFQLKIATAEGQAAQQPGPGPVAPGPVAPGPAVPNPPTPPVVQQVKKVGVKQFALSKNAKKRTLTMRVGWINGSGRVTYTATVSAKIGKKTVRTTVRGAGAAGAKNVRKTVKLPKAWKGKKVTVRLVVKNGSTTVVKTKSIRRF